MRILLSLVLLMISPLSQAQAALTVEQVAPGIYLHFGEHQLPDRNNHGAIANIGFIIGDQCVAVIDSGGNPQQGAALKKAIEATTDTPVCYVINTHVHPDHIYGNAAFKAENVHFIGHYKLARAMVTRGQYYIDKAAEQLDIELTADNLIAPDMPVKKHMTINLGNRELVLTAHRTAHTDNDLTVYDKKTDTLWLADLLFIDHLPVIDGSLKGWLAELERLEKQDYHYVIPGHGPLVTDWPAAMQPQKKYLTLLLHEIRAMIAQGKFIEEAVKTVGRSERQNWKLFDQFHAKNVTTAFAELEWED
ncbi:quinoprotein relay system zinc metallohydrolase 2 [Methylomarinum sp. Ch1-1]|uniref:Quinoprotein relay system zinc metallohydrolase 2 n=1 Tax=Methylomarinum roseum TaxID=3067653 RepID=A0AAU7NZX6_9GAMM|nr:quinoprotein relay system zinc metallohydrolase 2 [Methylomarinum sp. Ch1-1]MDP4520452.1 quinoprotein relay system zinc metallohydrolase 2 [Methylomarinum sp. Ch1-1]